MKRIAQYRKAITGIVGIGLSTATLYYTGDKWVTIAVGVAGALGIYAVPNDSKVVKP